MIMFNKPSWNNKREGFLRPPDKEQEERRQKLLHQMSETLSKKKEEFEERIEKIPLAELAQQQHFDLDASIEEEANKRIKITQPKAKTKPAPVVVPLHKEETVTDEKTKLDIFFEGRPPPVYRNYGISSGGFSSGWHRLSQKHNNKIATENLSPSHLDVSQHQVLTAPTS